MQAVTALRKYIPVFNCKGHFHSAGGITSPAELLYRKLSCVSPSANALNEASREALKLSRVMAPEDIDAYILEVLASENRPLAKKLSVLIMEAAKQGKPVHFS